jgi:3-methyladenine DNA glycosylase AlkD
LAPTGRRVTRGPETRSAAARKGPAVSAPESGTTAEEVLRQLAAAGTAQNRKVYARHGIRGEMYGVSYAALARLRKQIRVDHALAESLWATGNHDARVLATMVADPNRLSVRCAGEWVRAIDNHVLADAFAQLAARRAGALPLAQRWSAARGEWTGAIGWNVLAHLATSEQSPDDEFWEERLRMIEGRIHGSANRVRHAMNNTLIAIGGRNARLRRQAIGAAERIGKVHVDHGGTNGRTPDAAACIRRMAERKRAVGRAS